MRSKGSQAAGVVSRGATAGSGSWRAPFRERSSRSRSSGNVRESWRPVPFASSRRFRRANPIPVRSPECAGAATWPTCAATPWPRCCERWRQEPCAMLRRLWARPSATRRSRSRRRRGGCEPGFTGTLLAECWASAARGPTGSSPSRPAAW